MTETTLQGQMDRLKDLAQNEPDVYRWTLAFLIGAGGIDKELGEHINEAINYVERTYRP